MDTTTDLYVIGVGASAGGLKAISDFLHLFPEKPENFCVIIAQHISDDHKSELVSILQKRCKCPVETATHGKKLQPGFIYVTPPGHSSTVEAEKIKLLSSENEHPSPSVDLLFKSMARTLGLRAIGIVLSGYGHDGTEGTKAILENGGYVICQTPDTSTQRDMPVAAIDSGHCNCVLPPEKMYDEILDYIHNHQIVKEIEKKSDSLQIILDLLAQKTGTDFSRYKPTTIQRRITKRLEVLNLKDNDVYYQHIRKNPAELEKLYKTVLIGVTEFFRNAEAFEALKPLLLSLIQEKKQENTIRIWSVGCSAGHEPYSLIILLSELLGDKFSQYNLQIFATDIDDKALTIARKGTYNKEDLENMPAEYIEKYFEKDHKKYKIKKQLRRYILFTKHDVTIDTPFVRIDLIVCRNLLIYFNNELQRETLKLFHYAMHKNGLLFLGKSESISNLSDLFEKTGHKNKIYKWIQGSPIYSLQYNRFKKKQSGKSEIDDNHFASPSNISFSDNAKETLFRIYEHPYVIINDHFQVKQVRGSVRLYMEISEGDMDANIYKMVNPELRLDLRTLLTKVQKGSEMLQSRLIKFKLFDQEHFVQIKVTPLYYTMYKEAHYMILFEKINVDPRYIALEKDLSAEEFRDIHVNELEQELASAREHIQTFTEALEASNEELQSLNEELQSANEELKSANEELETSNEELQSTNEELNTANAELRHINEELVEKDNLLQASKNKLEKSELLYRTLTENYPNGTIGIVDNEHNVQFLAGKGIYKFNLKKEDFIGKKIYRYLAEDQQQIYFQMLEKAFQGEKMQSTISYLDQHYIVNVLPLDGHSAMFLTYNITELKHTMGQLEESEARFRTMADSAPVMIWMCGPDKLCDYFNKAWLVFTGRKEEQELGEGWFEGVHPEDGRRYLTIYKDAFEKREPYSIEYRLKGHDENYRWIIENGVPRYDNAGNFLGYIGGCMDIHALKELEKKKNEFINIASHELKTPLTTAKAYFQLVQEILLQQEGKPEIKKYVEKAIESLDKLNFLVEDLLDISRIETGKLTLSEDKFDFDDFVAEVIDDYRRIASHYQLTIKGKTHKKVMGDKRLLEQVIVNLLSNAVKFSPHHKKIDIILISDDGCVSLTVQDHGIGMALDNLKKIFEPFFQTNSKKFRSGLGLGLFICKGIIERHKGDITVTSIEGQGSAFSFRIPALH